MFNSLSETFLCCHFHVLDNEANSQNLKRDRTRETPYFPHSYGREWARGHGYAVVIWEGVGAPVVDQQAHSGIWGQGVDVLVLFYVELNNQP